MIRTLNKKMSGLLVGLLFAVAALTACGSTKSIPQPDTAAPADVPYSLTLKQLAGSDFPGLHSMIYASYGDYVVLMAGRLNGLHGFPAQNKALSNPSFPPDKKNTTAFLIEKATGKLVASASVNGLPENVVQQLTATNTQFSVVGDVTGSEMLYVVGGYGYTNAGDNMATLSQVMAVNLGDLVSAIKSDSLNANFAKQSIYVGSHPALAITGGALEQAAAIGGKGFLLVFGQQYDGVYSTGGGTATQVYSENVRKFNFEFGKSGQQLNKPVGDINVDLIWINPAISRTRPVEETEQYHRRDLTVIPTFTPDGIPQISALGGVFVPGQMAGFVNPVNIVADDRSNASGLQQTISLNVDTSTTQLMAQYKAGTVPVYSQTENAMYASIFAGISQYYWKDGKLNRDTPNFNVTPVIDGLPFINTISTLKVATNSSNQYLHNGVTFPPANAKPKCGSVETDYLGAETVFILADDADSENGVIHLDSISKPTVVGYLVGGIASPVMYAASKVSCASPTYYEVTLTPNQATSTTLLQLPPSN